MIRLFQSGGAKAKTKPASRAEISRWLIYTVTLVPLIAGLFYYTLEYLPRQREYFVNLRFRELNMLGGQAAARLNGLESSLRLQDPTKNSEAFIRDAFPHLKQIDRDKSLPSGRRFYFTGEAVQYCAAQATTCWNARLADTLADYVEDELFDDILLATPDGRVWLQRSQTALRIRDVNVLAAGAQGGAGGGGGAAASGSSSWFPQWSSTGPSSTGDGLRAPLLKNVELEGSVYQMFVSPIKVESLDPSGDPLLICGLVRRNRAEGEAMMIPPAYTLVMLAPVVLLLLLGPMIRLMTLTKTGRFSFTDAILLPVSTVLTLGLITIGLLTIHLLSDEGSQARRDTLTHFADRLNAQIVDDVTAKAKLLREIDAVAAGQKAIATRTHLGTSIDGVDTGGVDFDFVFWTLENGQQSEKWTRLKHVTPGVSQWPYPHFRDSIQDTLSGGHEDKNLNGLSMLHLDSPTTGQPISVITAKSSVKGHAAANLVSYPRHLLRPVTPPGVQFAVILRGSGQTVFHSAMARNLRENFYEETRSASGVLALARSGGRGFDEGYYRGRPHHFHVRPVGLSAGERMAIVTFSEKQPDQDFINLLWLRVLPLYAFAVALPALLMAGVAAMLRRDRHQLVAFSWPERFSPACRERQIGALLAILFLGGMFISCAATRCCWPGASCVRRRLSARCAASSICMSRIGGRSRSGALGSATRSSCCCC